MNVDMKLGGKSGVNLGVNLGMNLGVSMRVVKAEAEGACHPPSGAE